MVNLSSQDLQPLLNLKNLKRLKLERLTISFNNVLLPILLKFGATSLESLSLIAMSEVTISDIVQHCSKLRYLTVSDNECYHPPQQPLVHGHHLSALQHLTLDRLSDDDYDYQPKSADISFLLLSSPNLISLNLGLLDHLSEKMLIEVLDSHRFKQLQTLHFKQFRHIGERCFKSLFALLEQLKEIHVTEFKFSEDYSSEEDQSTQNDETREENSTTVTKKIKLI